MTVPGLAAPLLSLLLQVPPAAPPPAVQAAQHTEALQARVATCHLLPEVRSASALVPRNGRLLVFQDDYLRPAVLDPKTRRVTGDPRRGGAIDRMKKSDWEAAFTGEHGAVFILGSGARPPRRVVERLGADGKRVRLPGSAAFYDALEKALGVTPNLEGAVRLGPRVRLFHRGFAGAPSATLEVPLRALEGGPIEVSAPRFYDLGLADGVPLAFSDAAVLRGERIFFLSAAEAAPTAVQDGSLHGAAAGYIEGDRIELTLIREEGGVPTRRKFEGVVLDGDGAWVVTDPDDPKSPAELCRLVLRGPW